jgi:tyrosyl-tRNA synthetase
MQQVRMIMKRSGINEIMFVNNWDWTQGVSILEFLRDVGKHFTVNYMLAKDSVKNRIESGGISFTEFSYMLLQSFDYLHLYKNYNCKLQIGGSDQWGNITAGLELIRKKLGAETSALSIPLLTNSQGKKFGKSEGGAIWLDPEQTSPYKLYQYLLNVGDQDALKYLRMLTFLPETELQQIAAESQNKPEDRVAQQYLAKELCNLIHGEEATTEAIKSSSVLFSGELEALSPAKIKEIFADVPSTSISCEKTKNLSLADLLVEAGLAKSKGEARRLVAGGGAYLNEKRIQDANQSLSVETLTTGSILIFRSGKKNYALLELL